MLKLILAVNLLFVGLVGICISQTNIAVKQSFRVQQQQEVYQAQQTEILKSLQLAVEDLSEEVKCMRKRN